MPDDEGYQVAGDLQVGSYAALEGDLGEKLSWPLGFGVSLDDPEGSEGDVEDERVFCPGGFSTGAYSASGVRFICPEQLATWKAAWGH